jgi:hypothetical protein
LPCASISSIKYYTEDNTETTIQATDYFFDSFDKIWVKTLPGVSLRELNGMIIEAVFGEATAPEMAKQAILQLVSYWYENRIAVGNVGWIAPYSVHNLLDFDRNIIP